MVTTHMCVRARPHHVRVLLHAWMVQGTHGMFFRLNGAPIYSRGANMIPMEELEGRLDGEAHRILVKHSADAGMNTLRVWGGGIFYPSAFYDAADEYGVMVCEWRPFSFFLSGSRVDNQPGSEPT